MQKQPTKGTHRLEIDGDWEFLDFARLARPYVQVYSFFYALHSDLDREEPTPRIIQVFQDYPLMGGWSPVGYYDSLHKNTPKHCRPVIKSIHYSSPGFIEIGGVLATLWAFSKVINIVCDSFGQVEGAYHQLHKHAQERRILRANAKQKEVEVGIREIEFAERSTEVMSRMLGIDQEEFYRRTEDPVSRMEIMFSLYRRLKGVARFNRSQHMHVDFGSVEPEDQD